MDAIEELTDADLGGYRVEATAYTQSTIEEHAQIDLFVISERMHDVIK